MHTLHSLTQLAAESTHAAETAKESTEGISALGIDPLQILLQAGTFLILFFLFNKFALNKIVAILKNRQDAIDESLINAQTIDDKLQSVEAEIARRSSEAQAEANTIIGQSHEEAGAIIAQAQTEAQKQADSIMRQARTQADQEKLAASQALKSELLSLVADATEIVLGEKLDAKSDQALIERSIKRASAAPRQT